jgi:hypothetical protein
MAMDVLRRVERLVQSWPTQDQIAWGAATAPADPFSNGGGASLWKPRTRLTVAQAYSGWLASLGAQGLRHEDKPAARVTPDRVKAYFTGLRVKVAPMTAAGRIRDLAEALRVMEPGHDFAWLRRIARKLAANAPAVRKKFATTLPLSTLYELGLSMICDPTASRAAWQASRYRMGLMIAMLASCPIRRNNFVGLELGASFQNRGGRFVISLRSVDTKGGRPFEAELPVELSPYVDLYLRKHRPTLLNGRCSDRLWISWEGKDLSEAGFYEELRKITRKCLGVAISPHRFRDSAVTSVALEDPEHFLALLPILQHRSARTTVRSYNQAQQVEAVSKLGDTVQELRSRPSPSRRGR